jgi:hypothetical protein
MSTRWPNAPLVLRAVLLSFFLILTKASVAAEGGFSATLSTDQKNAAGFTALTPAQRNALDQLIAVEVSEARKENSSEFESTFVARRTEEERQLAGLDRLTPAQLTKLNGLVATAVAASPKPKERPRIKDSDVFSAPKKPEVHGEFSLTYGRASGGGDFRSASMFVDYFDPNSGLELSVGISRSSGKGLYGFCPDYSGFSPGYGYGYGAGLGFYGSPFRSFGRDGLYGNDGPLLGLTGDWDNSYYRGFRRR